MLVMTLTLSKTESELTCFWRANGWPKKKDGKWPSTEQIARKVGPGTIDVIYNYIYRLTSGTVHFSTRALLRTGWGKDENNFSFSTTNMGPYYAQFCRVYGLFLLTVYFEFFGTAFGMDDEVAQAVKALRRSLVMKNRWPEMITFEEMNVSVPKLNIFGLAMQSILAEEIENGFVATAENTKNGHTDTD